MRTASLVVAGVVVIACLVPPLSVWARRYEFAEAIQFSLLAIVAPALLVAGAPWRRLGLAALRPPADEDLMVTAADGMRPVDALALGRRRHVEPVRVAAFTIAYLVAVVAWRIPPSVDALARHPWLVVAEAVSVLVLGTGLWLELVESPPLTPRLARPHRIALAAVTMWSIWVLAYLVGFSRGSWYPAYPHHAGGGLSVSADQQFTTGLIWLISGCTFIPVVFWNLVRWLQSEENPDEELHVLIRHERIRGRSIGSDQTPS